MRRQQPNKVPAAGGFSKLRRAVFPLFAGAVLTVLVAWVCILWMPSRYARDPFVAPTMSREKVDPDGVKGLHYEQAGFGWTFTYLRGERFWSPNGKPHLHWAGPYGGTYHRVAGWPFYAMRSRVEVVDSQRSSRFSEGAPEPEVRPQRRRWELPGKEILYRGIASKDLPAWLAVQPDRRLPLIPMPFGFIGNAVVYPVVFFFIDLAWSFMRRQHHSTPTNQT